MVIRARPSLKKVDSSVPLLPAVIDLRSTYAYSTVVARDTTLISHRHVCVILARRLDSSFGDALAYLSISSSLSEPRRGDQGVDQAPPSSACHRPQVKARCHAMLTDRTALVATPRVNSCHYVTHRSLAVPNTRPTAQRSLLPL